MNLNHVSRNQTNYKINLKNHAVTVEGIDVLFPYVVVNYVLYILLFMGIITWLKL